jgi:hypothetical protein
MQVMIKRWPIFLLITLPLLIYWPLIFGGRALYWGLPLYQFYPWHTLVVEAIRVGQLPLWTDLLGNGAPLLANHQSAVFYPPNLIYLLMPVEQAMGYSVVLHLILSGLFAHAWGRAIGLSRFGATVTGLSFMLSGFFVARTQFITIVSGAAWLPLLFLLAERLIQRRTWLDATWLGVALALQFLAGHAQLWFYSLWVVGAYVLARALSVLSRRAGAENAGLGEARRQRGRVFVLLAGALILSLGLSAAQLLPTAELSLHSQRANGLDLDEAMTYSFWPWRLLTLAIPDLFGSPATGDYWGYATYWEDAGYIGVLPFLLALSVMWAWFKSLVSSFKLDSPTLQSLIPFLLFVALFALILAMGHNTPVYPLVFKYVPGFSAFRAPARFLLFYVFGVSTLAGLGADRFRLTYRNRYVARLTVAGAVSMLAASLAAGQVDLGVKPTFAPAIARFALWLGLSASVLLLSPTGAGSTGRQELGGLDLRVARSRLPLGGWRGLVVSLIAVDLALFAAPLTPTIAPTLYRATTEADRFLLDDADAGRLFATYDYDYNVKFNGYFDFSDWGSSDLAHWLSFRGTLAPNLNVFGRRPMVNNDDPLVIGRWCELMDVLRTADWPDRLRLLRMMNVSYVLAEGPSHGLSPIENLPHLYRPSEPLPRAWLVSQARVIPDPQHLLSQLMCPTFNPSTEVLLESVYQPSGQLNDLGLKVGFGSTSHPPSNPIPHPQLPPVAGSLREDGNSRTIDVVMSQPGYLVLAYTYYPGWRATVDGQPTEILRANYAFMALPLGPGEHRVALRYQPVSLTLGLFISGFSVLVVIGVTSRHVLKKSAN